METLFTYLAKFSLILTIFFLVYYLFLRKETFFKNNRYFLLTGLIVTSVLPLITIEKTIVLDQPASVVIDKMTDLNPITPINHPVQEIIPEKEIDWNSILILIYSTGVFAGILFLIKDYISLKRLINRNPKIRNGSFFIVNPEENIAPFSYFRYIVLNPKLYNEEEMENIIAHEKVHSHENHSIDVLISKLFCIVFWWNPIVYLYKNAIIQNLEFIADSVAIQHLENEKKYQYTLLKITSHQTGITITNQFYQSLIKKRIVMLNKQKSQKSNQWKFALVLPLLVIFMLQFQIKAIAQYKNMPVSEIEKNNVSVSKQEIKADFTNEQIRQVLEKFEKDFKIKCNFSKIKRNSKGQITSISIEMQSLANPKITCNKIVSNNKPIEPIIIWATNEQGKISFGFDDSIKENSTINVNGKGEVFSNISANATPPAPPVTPTPPVVSAVPAISAVPEAPPTPPVPATPTPGTSPNNPNVPLAPTQTIEHKISYKTHSSNEIFDDLEEDGFDPKNIYILFDGKEITYDEMLKINKNKISGLSKFNSGSKNYLIKMYGEKAANGAIIIESTNYVKNEDPKIDFKKPLLKTDNNGFIIYKKSKKDDFKFYQSELKKINIDFKYSGLKYNTNDEIIAIDIELIENSNGSKTKINSKIKNSKTPIKDIFIGKEDGKLVIK